MPEGDRNYDFVCPAGGSATCSSTCPGGGDSTSSFVPDCASLCIEVESQTNISVKFNPLRYTGGRTAILRRHSMSASCTPTAKKATRLFLSASFRRSAASTIKCSGSPCGAPSVIIKTHG